MEAEGLFEAKAELRERARAARRAMSPEEREAADAALCASILRLPEIAGVRTLLAYGATPEEANPAQAVAALRGRGIRIAYPRVTEGRGLDLHWIADDTDLVPGQLGLREPAPETPRADTSDIEAVLVPGVVFDSRGGRIGYGGGFYDRLLPTLPSSAVSVGLAYDVQLVIGVPRDAHDAAVDIVVTPSATLRSPSPAPRE